MKKFNINYWINLSIRFFKRGSEIKKVKFKISRIYLDTLTTKCSLLASTDLIVDNIMEYNQNLY